MKTPPHSLLLIGSYHMDNPSRDMHNPVADNVLAPLRQAQLDHIAHRVLAFRPTLVALEVPVDRQLQWTQDYEGFCQGRFLLTADERHQLGFRIARGAHLSTVHAIDWNSDWGDLGQVYTWAEEHQPDLFNRFHSVGEGFTTEFQSRQATGTLGELLAWINDPAVLRASHQFYLDIARVGHAAEYMGAEWVTGWYGRNLRIFVNLVRLLRDAGERALVIYGSGHIPLLEQFARDSGLFHIESAARYLL